MVVRFEQGLAGNRVGGVDGFVLRPGVQRKAGLRVPVVSGMVKLARAHQVVRGEVRSAVKVPVRMNGQPSANFLSWFAAPAAWNQREIIFTR